MFDSMEWVEIWFWGGYIAIAMLLVGCIVGSMIRHGGRDGD